MDSQRRALPTQLEQSTLTYAESKQKSLMYPNATQPYRNLPPEILLEVHACLCASIRADEAARATTSISLDEYDLLFKKSCKPSINTSDRLGIIAVDAFHSINGSVEANIAELIDWYPPKVFWEGIRHISVHYTLHIRCRNDHKPAWSWLKLFADMSLNFKGLPRVTISLHVNFSFPAGDVDRGPWYGGLQTLFAHNPIKVRAKELDIQISAYSVAADEYIRASNVPDQFRNLTDDIANLIRGSISVENE